MWSSIISTFQRPSVQNAWIGKCLWVLRIYLEIRVVSLIRKIASAKKQEGGMIGAMYTWTGCVVRVTRSSRNHPSVKRLESEEGLETLTGWGWIWMNIVNCSTYNMCCLQRMKAELLASWVFEQIWRQHCLSCAKKSVCFLGNRLLVLRTLTPLAHPKSTKVSGFLVLRPHTLTHAEMI